MGEAKRRRESEPAPAASGEPAWGSVVWVLALVGGVIGPILDYLHVRAGLASYTSPAIGPLAAWVPPLFAFGAVVMGLFRPAWEAAVGPTKPTPRLWTLAMGFFALLAAYLVTAVLPWDSLALNLLVGAIFALTWWATDRTVHGLGLALVMGCLGTAWESSLGWLGVYHYVEPDLAGVPLWLPWLYAIATLTLGNVGMMLRATQTAKGPA